MRLLLTVGVLSISLSAQMPPPAPPIPSGSNLITGRVIDGETGAPVATAIVTLTLAGAGPGRQSAERVLTDAQGRFFFDSLGASSFNIIAAKPGWIEGASGRVRPGGSTQSIVIRDGERPPDVPIRLWRYAVISGRVVDDLGDPLVATDVRIFHGSFSAGRRQWSFVDREITDDRGMYRFSQLLPGAYLVVVPAAVTTEPESLRAAATLPDSYYQTMSPIGAAPVTFRPARMTAGRGSLVTSIIDVPRPSSADSPWLTYPTTFFPSSTSIGTATVVDAVAGRERPGVDVVMRFVPTFSVSGTVTTPPGVPSSTLAVHLLPADSAANPLFDVATAITDQAGAFTFYGVPAGQYVARIVRTPAPGAGLRFAICGGTGDISYICQATEKPTPGPPPMPTEPLLHADAPVSVTDSDVRAVALDLGPGARVAGRVELEGAAPRPTPAEWRGMSVLLDPAGGQVHKAAGTPFETNSPGRFTETGQFATPSTWPGRYVVRVTGLPAAWSVKRVTVRGRDVLNTPLDLATDVDDVVITLTDQKAQLSGTVERLPDQANTDVSVLLFPADPAGWLDYGRSTRRLRSTPVTGGSYSIPSPPEGDYYLIAVPEAQADDWQNPSFLKRTAALADRVTVADGRSTSRPLRVRSLQ